jgi:phosphoribosylaminoimidazolecarboxamide formyltransferase/IMP cyclohydrolase
VRRRTAATLADAFRDAWEGDPQSAFGGVLAFNKPVDADTAAALMDPKAKRFIECVIAPEYDPQALDALKKWKKTFVAKRADWRAARFDYRRVDGGLQQTRDVGRR